MDPAVAGFVGGLVGGVASFLAFILQRRSEAAGQRETLVAAIRGLHAELIGNANALLAGHPDEISTENWNRYQDNLARVDRIGPAIFPWDHLGGVYWKLRTIASGRSTPSPEFAGDVQKLADELVDIAARAFDVHFHLPLPPAPSLDEIHEAAAPTMPPAELPGSGRIERAIASRRVGRRGRVERALKESSLLALGRPAGDTSIPGQGTESELVHSVVNRHDHDYTILPVFTRAEYLVSALQMNRDWLGTSVLEVEGDPLVENIHDDVNLAINPWSPTEFFLPAKRRRSRLR